MMGASLQTAILQGITADNVDDDFDAFTSAPSHQGGEQGLGIADHNAIIQPLGDPMDFDLDLDAVCWAVCLDHSASRLDPGPEPDDYSPPTAGLPADFLFAEDEGALPSTIIASYQGQHSDGPGDIQVPRRTESPSRPPVLTLAHPGPGDGGARNTERNLDGGATDHDLARERLRRQLSLLSKGWCGDEIRFKNCDPSKAVILHNLAMELGLGYHHNVRSREVSLCRLDPVRSVSGPQPTPGDLSSSLPRSSTELDSALCLPGLPTVPDPPLPQEAVPFTDSASPRCPPATSVTADRLLSRSPSRSERISDSISKHVSTLKRSISKGGRRGPLSENGRRDMRALEGAGGACWRCKVLRRKCDLGSPCRCCLQSVPMPHLGEEAPLWPLIGCRRGPLRDSVPPQLLCPGSQRTQNHGPGEALALARRCCSMDLSDRCLLSAESQRLADMKAVFEGASFKLSITDPILKDCFFSFIKAGRYRDRESLHTNHSFNGKMITYTELIAIIAWELAENQALLPLLEIKSWESFMSMLETACIYEAEVGQTSLVILSLVCLRHSLEALRLHSANLLLPGAHEDCGGGQCQVECIHNLSVHVSAYVDELSAVIFNKDNLRDRRWWLSTFYSFYISSYVRHALITIEKQLRFRSLDDVAAEDLAATQYLHLPAVLFTAASAKYDPLLGGRLQYALTDNSVILETSVPDLHHSSARAACEVDKWPDAGIRTPYQFLRRQLQIGSLDFEPGIDASGTSEGPRSSVGLSSPSSACTRAVTSLSPSPAPGQEGLPSLRCYRGRRNRDSMDSYYSSQPSTVFSNRSSDSLARTMSTDLTSIYEPSILTGVAHSDSMADLDAGIGSNISTISPTALFSANQGFVSQPFNPLASEGPAGVENPTAALDLPFVCNCCPRAPRQFHTTEELEQHEAEKPHPCTQCKKRFKSPTEAERHINAIHLKSDSWSCKVLENALLAFQPETFNGVVWDICGFCGGGFARKGDVADQSELVTHLEAVHKIGECDRNKKFYRADNFRQHLKNTHVAKPGNWLKVLERVCRTTRDAMYEPICNS
ncbi:hypothetical protein VTK56DRAFT_9403 [Thermocarpiscus australiensis]